MKYGNWTYEPSVEVFIHKNGHEVDATLCRSAHGILWNVAHLNEACGWANGTEIGDLIKLMFKVGVKGTRVHERA